MIAHCSVAGRSVGPCVRALQSCQIASSERECPDSSGIRAAWKHPRAPAGRSGASLSAQVIPSSLSLVFRKRSPLMCALSEDFPAAGTVGSRGSVPNRTHRIRCCLWRCTRSYRSTLESQPEQKLGLSSPPSSTITFPKQRVVVVGFERKRDFFLFNKKKEGRTIFPV